MQRIFILGDEWVYLKIYVNPAESDRILLDSICSLKDKLLNDGIIDKWFYLRYGDPDYHLRIRFHLVRTGHLGLLIGLFNDAIKQDIVKKYIWKIQADTYNREMERYGGELTIEFSESLFFHQSEMVLHQLNELRSNRVEEKRMWIPVIMMIDELLNIFEFSVFDKCNQFKKLTSQFLDEFNYNTKDKKYLSNKYREVKGDVYNIMNGNLFIKDCLYIKKTSTTIQKLFTKYALQKSNIKHYNIVSYIHMLINRYFDNCPRAHELVIYYILWTYYKSIIAQNAKAMS